MQSNMKGFISAWVAVGAIALLIFVANASLNITSNNDAFIKMEAAREVNVKANNLIWILDKATSKNYFDYLSAPSCDQFNADNIRNYLQAIITNFNSKSSVDCIFTTGPVITVPAIRQVLVTGVLECSVSLDGTDIIETRTVAFYKQGEVVPGLPDTCKVVDRVSLIIEES
ncbi:MAG: hypothetical protein ABIH20_03535 [Candidatus Diapherotrites archaeon]